MSAVAVSPRIRLIVAGMVGVALIAAAIALASGSGGAAALRASPLPAPPPGHIASVAARGAAGHMSANQVLKAARTCASHAAAAGWANNGVYGGNLVTAVAVCVAESGGHPAIFHCDATGAIGYYPPVNCASGSYDRGLWQLNSQYQTSVSDSCAFRAQCNANSAYRISASGASFSPWAVYDSDIYTTYLHGAQAAVSGLTTGAVASGVFGVCLARAQEAAGAAAVVGRCSHSTAAQQWTLKAGALTDGTLCLAAGGPGQPSVTLATCDGSAGQRWARHGLAQLRNAGPGRCLNDPGASTRARTGLRLAKCSTALEEAWWLP
jgi:hypothetical protein